MGLCHLGRQQSPSENELSAQDCWVPHSLLPSGARCFLCCAVNEPTQRGLRERKGIRYLGWSKLHGKCSKSIRNYYYYNQHLPLPNCISGCLVGFPLCFQISTCSKEKSPPLLLQFLLCWSHHHSHDCPVSRLCHSGLFLTPVLRRLPSPLPKGGCAARG